MSKPYVPENPLLKQHEQAERRSYFSKAGKKQKPTSNEHTVAPGHQDN